MRNLCLPYLTCWKITILIDPTITNSTRRNVESFVNNNEKKENGKNVNSNRHPDRDQDQDPDLDHFRVHVRVHTHAHAHVHVHLILIIHALPALNVSFALSLCSYCVEILTQMSSYNSYTFTSQKRTS